jgi:glycosyltransferase involved in cell wall biosynthesis
MKILHVSNFYYERGGDCTYLFSLMKLLEKKKHKNIVFSMHHPQNFSSVYDKYFVSYINYAEEFKNMSFYSSFKVLCRTIYSVEARKKIEKIINDTKPDIAHLQNIHHHITPSVFYALKKHDIPIVWTLHDYTLICPNTLFLCRGHICEKCKTNKFYWPIIERCKKNSLGASTVAAIETIMHRIMNVYRLVDFFITPSDFLRNKLIEYGFKRNKIIRLNNFIDAELYNEKRSMGNYYVYVGRLTEEKGIKTLIDAALKVDSGRLKIIGDGPLKDELFSYTHYKKGNNKIEFLGYRTKEEVIRFLSNCKFMVLPSECYENFPYSVLEAFACGKTVIGSRIGGIPELVKDRETGITFEAGNVDDLSLKIEYLMNNSHESLRLGQNARGFVEQKLNAEKHYQELIKIYQSVV